jgi:uncharacterized membrane protein (DUF2068 family)
MRFPLYAIFLLLMLLGNCFALFKMFSARQAFLTQFPKLTGTAFNIFRFLPLINCIAIAGMWWLKPWGAYLALTGGIAIIFFDIYHGIYYHLYVAVPSFLILLFFIIRYWKHFE